MIGTTIAHYRMGAKLGEGGMGEVWRATDTRLKREVAIKLLPRAFTDDPERLARFEREAQALAQLQHPNIASIYGLVEDEAGVRAIVLELVEGATLAERLEGGALPIPEALEIARQISLALEAAHEKGIVHRDLKPQNIKAPAEGAVKILDFGLAKALEPAGASSPGELAKSPTLTLGATVHGVLLGTAAYMAPEQAKGTAIDKRADVWAFGVVLWEMLSGRRLFAGDSVPETLAEVLKSEIDLGALPPATPAAIRRLLRRCLERSPRNRLHDIADARLVIEDVLEGRADENAASTAPAAAAGAGAGAEADARRRGLRLGAALGAAAAALVALGALALLGRPPGRGEAAAAGEAGRPAKMRTLVAGSGAGWPALSPDGGTLAFVASRRSAGGEPRVWIKDLASGSESPLGPVGSDSPSFSPDGTSVLYRVEREGPDELFRIALATRETRRVASDSGELGGADWSSDGKSIAFGRQKREGETIFEELVVLDPGSGAERVVARDPADAEFGLLIGAISSPDGRRVARLRIGAQAGLGDRIVIFDVATGKATETAIDLPGLDGIQVVGADWISNDRLALLLSDAWSRIASSGRLAVFDVATRTTRSVLPLPSVRAGLAVAGPGAVVVGLGADQQSLWEVPLTGRTAGEIGAATRRTEGPFFDRQPVYSPDGRWLVFTSNRSGNLDLWRLEVATDRLERLTDHAGDDWDPGLSADGRQLAFSSNRTGRFQIWLAEADGSSPRRLTDVENAQNPTFTPDGGWIYFTLQDAGPDRIGLWRIRPDGSDASRVLAGSAFVPEVSGDGRFVAFNRTREGALVPAEGGTPISLGAGATRFRWTLESGRQRLWVLGSAGRESSIRRFEVESGPALGAATPVLTDPEGSFETFAVRPDGGALVVSRTTSENTQIVRIEGLAELEAGD